MPTHRSIDTAARFWIRWTLLFWAIGMVALICTKWNQIYWLGLSDTDDNIRFAQVSAWLNGQGWYDLRQYKLDPPLGASIHWSRFVDLPIAGIILATRPFLGAFTAARVAVAAAPLIPLGLALFATVVSVRRLVGASAFAMAAGLFFCMGTTLLMFMPTRIDHHGWQLALLATVVAGSADPRPRRGGLVTGAAMALSLTIGLEMLPYLALATGAVALRWAWDRDQAARMAAHGIALGLGSTLGFVLFASHDNRLPVCDALSPVWLSASLLGGGLFVALAAIQGDRRAVRLAAAIVAAGLLAGGFALAWPQCLGAPERLSPELRTLWFAHINEVRPLYRHGWRTWLPVGMPPVVGLIGYAVALWRARGTPALLAWATVALLALTATLLMLWQTRSGPPAQLLAVPGLAALAWIVLPWLAGHRWMLVRVFGTVAGFLLVSGVVAGLVVRWIPEKDATVRSAPGNTPRRLTVKNRVAIANRRCPTLPALRPLARVPAATVLTFIDLAPRLIAMTHHRAIAGPYHRNQAAILDVIHAFRGPPDQARAVMVKHGATLLLTCPGMSESTIYNAEAKGGFYWQLARGRVPAWLVPVPLPKNSPFKLWRRVG
ncbi:MAG TPA: AcrB/AcrD/AcrF family protein [Sphingomonas sp.]|uniref:AcrB/AcrD/AcrF family protein n=1 Tax=Sphingomonas sp. TaxID=28214 RepID=UPI002ED8F6BE